MLKRVKNFELVMHTVNSILPFFPTPLINEILQEQNVRFLLSYNIKIALKLQFWHLDLVIISAKLLWMSLHDIP